jgi:hypothetical protein
MASVIALAAAKHRSCHAALAILTVRWPSELGQKVDISVTANAGVASLSDEEIDAQPTALRRWRPLFSSC